MVVYNWGEFAYFGTENWIAIFSSDFGTFVPEYILANVQNNIALVIIQNISRPRRFSSVSE